MTGHVPVVMASPVGPLGIHCTAAGRLKAIELLASGRPLHSPPPHARPAWEALAAYFRDPREVPEVPLELAGTDFQHRVWTALGRIPPGEVLTYGELARQLGTAPRALGQACRANPVPILVPCHRVVAATGRGGYAGATGGRLLAIKRWLLAHEASR